jgi:hypothetical protein
MQTKYGLKYRSRHRSDKKSYGRKGGDSNSRGAFAPAGFRNRCIRPLCHLSNKTILASGRHKCDRAPLWGRAARTQTSELRGRCFWLHFGCWDFYRLNFRCRIHRGRNLGGLYFISHGFGRNRLALYSSTQRYPITRGQGVRPHRDYSIKYERAPVNGCALVREPVY